MTPSMFRRRFGSLGHLLVWTAEVIRAQRGIIVNRSDSNWAAVVAVDGLPTIS